MRGFTLLALGVCSLQYFVGVDCVIDRVMVDSKPFQVAGREAKRWNRISMGAVLAGTLSSNFSQYIFQAYSEMAAGVVG